MAGGKLGILIELWAFMKERKKWWLGPIVVLLLLLALLLVFTSGVRSGAVHLYALSESKGDQRYP